MEEKTEIEVLKTQTVSPDKIVTTKKTIKDPNIKTEPPQKVFEKKKTIFRSYQIIWYLLGVIEFLLLFRLILRLFGADPNVGFSNFIYTLSGPFANPFFGVVAPTTSPYTMAYIEWSTILAMFFYIILAYGIMSLVSFIKPPTSKEIEEAVEH